MERERERDREEKMQILIACIYNKLITGEHKRYSFQLITISYL